MKQILIVALILAAPAYAAIRSLRQPQAVFVAPPLGTPEAPELRNDPTKPLQILNASCLRAFDPAKQRCTAQVKFADTGGPWSGFALHWIVRYENGTIVQGTWGRDGRLPDGILPNHNRFQNGSTATVGDRHVVGLGQLAITNVTVEVERISK